MKKRSDFYQPGQKLTNTLLTIVDSVRPNSWAEIICLCECGRTITLTYTQVYAGKYSCGCRRRLRDDRVDYTNIEAHNGNGNFKHGRSLTVIGCDITPFGEQQWQYLCQCCGELFFVPRGGERGLARTLRDLAGRNCPNWREPWYVPDDIEWLSHNGVYLRHDPQSPDGWYEIPSQREDAVRCVAHRVPRTGSKMQLAMSVVPLYAPSNVIWRGRPRVLVGFRGMPEIPGGKLPFYINDDQRKYGLFGKPYNTADEDWKVAEDADGFGDLM